MVEATRSNVECGLRTFFHRSMTSIGNINDSRGTMSITSSGSDDRFVRRHMGSFESRLRQQSGDPNITFPVVLKGAAEGIAPLLKLLFDCFRSYMGFLDPEIVEVLLSHLDAFKVPSFDSLPPTAAYTDIGDGTVTFNSLDIERARMVIWGFKDVYYDKESFELVGEYHDFTPILLSSWFGVYRWIEYLFQAVIVMDLGDESFKLSFVVGSIHLFAFFSWIDEVHELLAKTPGSMKLLTQLWLLQLKLPNADPYAGTILMNVIRTGKKHDLDEMAEAVDGSATALVEEILEPYRQFQSAPSAILEDRILSFLPIFNHFAERPKHILCREILTNNGVREVIKSYLQCAINPLSSRSHKYIIHAPGVLFSFFGELWRCNPGYTWVIQAFRAGLLELFVRCWPFLPLDDNSETVDEEFMDFSMRYLAVLPVLQAASTAIREVRSKLDMETRIKLAPLKSADAWRKFESVVEDLKGIAEGLFDSRLKNYESICDNCQGYTDEIKKCQGCERAYYCSMGCQSQAWRKGGHRNVCDSIPLSNDGNGTVSQTVCNGFTEKTGMHIDVLQVEPDKTIHRKFLLRIAMKELERNIVAFFSSPYASYRSFTPNEEVESIGAVIALVYPRDIVLRTAIPDEDWLENDRVVYLENPDAKRRTVKLSENATLHLKVAISRGEHARIERYEVPNVLESLRQSNRAKNARTLTVVRALPRLEYD